MILLYFLIILVILGLAIWMNDWKFEKGGKMDIQEMLFTLANIQETKFKKAHYKRFFESLTLEELADLGAYMQVVKETANQTAIRKIMKGESFK